MLPQRLRVLADTIQAGLPFAEFTLWSAARVVELAPWNLYSTGLAHMMPTHHVAFVEAERDVAATIYEVLLAAGEHVLLDPSREARAGKPIPKLHYELEYEPVVYQRRGGSERG